MMKVSKGLLIIIPGLGDRVELYGLVTPFWRLLGYEPHIFSFGWEDADEDFAAAIMRLVDYLDNLQTTRVNIIGVSAGGTAAINALVERRQVVRAVATVATPYEYLPHLKNKKLKTSIKTLNEADPEVLKTKVLSIHGLYDQIVPVASSRPSGVRTLRLPMVCHGCIIAIALTVCSFAVSKCFKDVT